MRAPAIFGVSLALGLLFNWLFFDKTPGISVLIYVAAIVAGLFALAKYLRRPVPGAAQLLLAPLGFFAAMLAVRDSEFLGFLNVLACVFLLLLVARTTFRDDLRKFNLIDYLRVPFLPLRFVGPLFSTVGDFLRTRSAASRHGLTAQVGRGILLAVPALVLFAVLLSSADLVFQKYITSLFRIDFSPETYGRILLVGFVTLAFMGAYSYIFRQPSKPESDDPASSSSFPIGKVELSILLGSVGTLFLAFLIIQFAYLFGGASNMSAQGFTYAEYARKGFFELLAVAVAAFAMLWAADKFAAKTARGHEKLFKILSGVLTAEVLLIMVSAFKRLYLYEQAFGFTTLRLYSHAFVIFLAVIFGLLLIKIVRNQSESKFALPAFAAGIVFLAGMNLLNPDAFIARQNLERYHQTGKLDAGYIGNLSDDAHREKIKALEFSSPAERDKLQDALDRRSAPSDWQSWNLSRAQVK